MIICQSCGKENADGMRYCVRCGTMLPPPPGSWKTPEEKQTAYGSVNQTTLPPTYDPQTGTPYYGQPSTAEPVHPAIPALVSLFFPGLGLLFVPNKLGLAVVIFIGYCVAIFLYSILAFILSFIGIGLCMFLLIPLVNVLIALHSYDEAAKASNGKFQPILFK
ncbi:MAG: hypothetical protein C4334_10105 [Pyrinomonas sp.]|uniref:zinc ribbon domain-containing protein n=1 Tax=Pyrinomonas sp. TaxID=2080306 RepID=UPI003317B289